jgi:predicted RNase H-like nuclease (RuvC/YqgF family)
LYLVCAPIESVAEKRVIFEKWTVIAQQVDTGAGVERRINSCLQDKDFICGQDHDGVQPQEHDLKKYTEEMVAYMKKMEREYLQQEVLWQERIQRKDRALIRAQILIQEFLSNGTDLLMSEDKASTIEADLSNANQKIQSLQEELDALKKKFAETKDAGIEVSCATPAAPPQSSKKKEPCATHAAPPQTPQPLPEDDIQNLKPSSLSAEDLQELREGLVMSGNFAHF